MVRFILSAVQRETRGMHEAAYLLAMVALSSQLLSLIRDRLFASAFGAGETLDLYWAAFRIPDILFATVASLLSLYALLPILSSLEEKREGLAASFLRQTLFLFFVGMGAVAGVMFFLAPLLLPLVAPGIASDPSLQEELLLLVRILLLQPILLGASNIVLALTQMQRRFFLYAISPVLYNIGIIVGVLFFYPVMGISGLGLGVVLGALLHLLVQLPFFMAQTSALAFSFGELGLPLRQVLALSLPRTLTLASGQLTILILIAAASLFAAGSISIFSFAFNLQAVPLTIIGVSYSVAAFPTLARLYASGKQSEFVRHIEAALRHVVFWSVPAMVLVIVLRAQLVRTILGVGEFDWDATRLTAAALALFILSLVCQSVTLLIARGYYAAGKTGKPLFFALLSVVVAVSSSFLLVAAFHASPLYRYFIESVLRVTDIPGTTVLMLALGYALGAVAQCIVGLWYFSRDFGVSLLPLRRLLFQSFAAGVLGGVAAYATLWFMDSLVDINTVLGIVSQGFAGGVVGLAATTAVLVLLKNQELAEAIGALRRRFADTTPVALEPTDVSS